MSYSRYLDAERQMNEGLIRRNLSIEREGKPPRDPRRKMAAMRAFLDDCGHPEKGIPAVHIAGTSGKGSVAAATAGILREAGLKVGLHVSPYLQSATEKIWIDGRFVSADEFADLVDWIMPIAQKRLNPQTPASVHGMASVIIALEGFRRAGVDVMVFEAGCGGRHDLSNILDSVATVVTNVGLDHVVSLGPTLEDIAWHKAGIAKPGVPMITCASGGALDIIARETEVVGAPLYKVAFDIDRLTQNIELARETAIHAGAMLGLEITQECCSRGERSIRMAGRVEEMPGEGPRIILDGAHNPEKLEVAVDAALRSPAPGKRVLLFGAIGAKASPALVAPLLGRFDHIIATEPTVYAKSANPATATAALFKDAGCPVSVASDPNAGFEQAMSICDGEGNLIVTGSFYLLSTIRERFYPKRAVVLQGSSFPVRLEK